LEHAKEHDGGDAVQVEVAGMGAEGREEDLGPNTRVNIGVPYTRVNKGRGARCVCCWRVRSRLTGLAALMPTLTPLAALILAPCPWLSLKIASAWHPDLTSSPLLPCSSIASRMSAMAPVSLTSLAFLSFPTIRLANASNTNGSKFALLLCLLRLSRMHEMPPCAAIRLWLCAFWHMLESAPQLLFNRSAHCACIRMPFMITGMPPNEHVCEPTRNSKSECWQARVACMTVVRVRPRNNGSNGSNGSLLADQIG